VYFSDSVIVQHSSNSDAGENKSRKKVHDSKVSILEKQLEYMRRLVHNAEQERIKATERMCAIEQEKENQVSGSAVLTNNYMTNLVTN
jgi:hypothetical protein